jgi:hypothetical protein
MAALAMKSAHLIRIGAPSQRSYLTGSALSLSLFIMPNTIVIGILDLRDLLSLSPSAIEDWDETLPRVVKLYSFLSGLQTIERSGDRVQVQYEPVKRSHVFLMFFRDDFRTFPQHGDPHESVP